MAGSGDPGELLCPDRAGDAAMTTGAAEPCSLDPAVVVRVGAPVEGGVGPDWVVGVTAPLVEAAAAPLTPGPGMPDGLLPRPFPGVVVAVGPPPPPTPLMPPVVVVVVDGVGPTVVARTCDGAKLGALLGLDAPKVHASTLPAWGTRLDAPAGLCVQLPAPESASQ